MTGILLDTSAAIALIERHDPAVAAIVARPEATRVSPLTLAELAHGYHSAPTDALREMRLQTYEDCKLFETAEFPADETFAWGHLSAKVPRRVGGIDRWLIVTARAHNLLLLTFDANLYRAACEAGQEAFVTLVTTIYGPDPDAYLSELREDWPE